MLVKSAFQQGPILKIEIKVKIGPDAIISELLTKEYVINQTVTFQVKNSVLRSNSFADPPYRHLISFKFSKINDTDDKSYTAIITSKELGIEKQIVTTDNFWREISEKPETGSLFSITFEVTEAFKGTNFASLYDDTDLTDFNLKGEHGSVAVHRAILAVYSPVFKTMLGKTWKDTTEGCINIPGLSTETFKDFKAYLYLHQLPDSNLEDLLLLASCYMISDLERKCINKIITSLTSENLMNRLDFAVQHKMDKLTLAIMDCVQTGTIEVNHVRKHVLSEENKSDPNEPNLKKGKK